MPRIPHEEARARFVAAKAAEGLWPAEVWGLVYEVQEIARARQCCEQCYARQVGQAEQACQTPVQAIRAEGA